jgi:predicted nuclease of restriction endonuclease-like (RecB) superfamily
MPTPKTPRRSKLAPPIRRTPDPSATGGPGREFEPVLTLIHGARARLWRAANVELVELYWNIGEYIARRVAERSWGRGTVEELSAWLLARDARLRGLSASNLWRMRQFYETYAADNVLAPLVRELPWTSNLLILGRCKLAEERGFYLRLAIEQRWSTRELERQLEGALFERSLAGKPAMSAALQVRHPGAVELFKDRYLLDFLQLPEPHAERDLQHALLGNLKQFLIELGRDFCFVGEEYRLQVGDQDFFIDLLFFHRSLQALVAIELKIDAFKPAHLGQLEFYLEALDRDHRNPHEASSIGVLLCKTRDAEVVEYALSRSLSPTLVAEYQTKLPDKAMLEAKLDELFALLDREADGGDP